MMTIENLKAQAMEIFRHAYAVQRAGQIEEAQRLYRRSIATLPTAEAHTFLAWTYSAEGKIPDAIAECKLAIEVDPDFGNPYNDIGAYYIELGQYDDAVPWLKKAKDAVRYEVRHFPYLNLGRVYLAKGWLNRALDEFEVARRLEPRDPIAKNAIVHIRAKLS